MARTAAPSTAPALGSGATRHMLKAKKGHGGVKSLQRAPTQIARAGSGQELAAILAGDASLQVWPLRQECAAS